MSNFNLVYRRMEWSDLRCLCIKYDWCTCMTNEEYEALLAHTESHINDAELYLMANIIYEGTHRYNSEAYSDEERKDSIAYIITELNRICTYHM